MSQKQWTTVITIVFILLAISLCWFLNYSKTCGEAGAIWELTGICLVRRSLSIVLLLALEVAFGIGAGLQAKAKNYSFIFGFTMGFFLSFLGALFILMLSPREKRPLK